MDAVDGCAAEKRVRLHFRPVGTGREVRPKTFLIKKAWPLLIAVAVTVTVYCADAYMYILHYTILYYTILYYTILYTMHACTVHYVYTYMYIHVGCVCVL